MDGFLLNLELRVYTNVLGRGASKIFSWHKGIIRIQEKKLNTISVLISAVILPTYGSTVLVDLDRLF
jgi:hypothetical protein